MWGLACHLCGKLGHGVRDMSSSLLVALPLVDREEGKEGEVRCQARLEHYLEESDLFLPLVVGLSQRSHLPWRKKRRTGRSEWML